jgi:hypothetical protein
MKITPQSLIKLAVCTATLGFSLLIPQSSRAQVNTVPNTDPNPLQDLNTQENRDPFSRTNDGDAFGGIMQLMQRAQMGTIRSTSEFTAEQDRSINDAAAQFRQRQLEMIRNQNQPQPANTIKTPK